MKNIFLLFGSLFIFGFGVVGFGFLHAFAEITEADIPIMCQTIFGVGKVPSKFASPVNFFSSRQEVLVNATCLGRDAVQIEVGNGEPTQYIYKYGYTKVGSGLPNRFSLSGTKTVGSWIVGSASAQIDGIKSGEIGEIAVYLCQRIGTSWKCGCSDKECVTSKWLLQKYELTNSLYTEAKNFFNDTEADVELPQAKKLDIFYASQNMVYAGDKLVLTGYRFATSSKNDILWNGQVMQTKLTAVNDSTLVVVVPTLPPGKYEVKVRVGDAVSAEVAHVWIKTPGAFVAPKISSISPEVGTQGGTFTVYGEGFTNKNDLVTTFGVLEGYVSEDGKKITFTYDPFEEKLESWDSSGERYHYKQPVSVSVYNTSGASNIKQFYLEI